MSLYKEELRPTIQYNIKKLYRQLSQDNDVKVYVRNNPKNKEYINWTIVTWAEKYPESSLFSKSYNNMEPYERLEILRLMILSKNMSILLKAEEYNVRVSVSFDEFQANNIGDLYGIKVPQGLVDFYIVNDGYGVNLYWSDFLFNKNTLVTLQYRLQNPPNPQTKFNTAATEQIFKAIQSDNVYSGYAYYFTGSNILEYLNLRPSRDYDLGKLPDAPAFTVADPTILLEIEDLTGDHQFTTDLTGVPYLQTIYSPKLWFLYRGIKYHILALYIYKKFARSNIKSYADLISLGYYTDLPIIYPKLPAKFNLSVGKKQQIKPINRDKFIDSVYDYFLKLYDIPNNKSVKQYIQDKFINGGSAARTSSN